MAKIHVWVNLMIKLTLLLTRPGLFVYQQVSQFMEIYVTLRSSAGLSINVTLSGPNECQPERSWHKFTTHNTTILQQIILYLNSGNIILLSRDLGLYVVVASEEQLSCVARENTFHQAGDRWFDGQLWHQMEILGNYMTWFLIFSLVNLIPKAWYVRRQTRTLNLS